MLQRKLEHRLVDPPALPPGDLEDEYVGRVVMHGEAGSRRRRQVRVRLRGGAEARLEHEPFGVAEAEDPVEAARLAPVQAERPSVPELGQEPLGGYRGERE